MTDKIFDALRANYDFPELLLKHYNELLSSYVKSGMAPPNLQRELETGKKSKLFAHVWEAMLYQSLLELGSKFVPSRVTKAGQDGPDFGIVIEGRTIWIEATVPEPIDLPPEWLAPPKIGECRVREMPHEAMLLRWTNAISTKRAKVDRYLEKGVVDRKDSVFIAINACRLSDFSMDDHGITQLPYAVEAVFPVGPIAIKISPYENNNSEAIRTLRYSIEKKTGIHVSTGNFLDPAYASISGVIGCINKDTLDNPLRLTVVHNPLAVNPVPTNLFHAEKEYLVTEENGEYLLSDIRGG